MTHSALDVMPCALIPHTEGLITIQPVNAHTPRVHLRSKGAHQPVATAPGFLC